ncbi:membrane protein [Actinomycetospora sp. NBRC 106375]|uniref:DUF4231 domain-containing protein n=1 Tax=Actinomycetospora sp. NBRC 106375 TaxID=3032207 RepID=UPI0024A2688F|nr:DUF4231 domain-containing protein [Actinomycetospora sp. NBRC 106375]GLZ46624.1 membrane protein [Actinomycetospora sp. NBRC 106375]
MTDEVAKLAYPGSYDAAGEASLRGQKRYMGLVGVRSVALVIAALGGAVSWSLGGIDVFAWAALIAFLLALAVEVLTYALAPEQVWYEGRAAAESVKTLTWRYCVGGDPFPSHLSEQDASALFLAQLSELTTDLNYIPPPIVDPTREVTDSMKRARASSFDTRKSLYLAGRILDQVSWYSKNAQANDRWRQVFLLLTILIEFAGVLAATFRTAGAINFDMLGILAAMAAGLATWAQTRQYGLLARSYSIAAHELNVIRSEVESKNGKSWARFVDEAEEAVSREHTLWRASRGVLTRPGRSPWVK